MLPPKLCNFVAKTVYLDAISMTSYELFFKLLYVYMYKYYMYILLCRIEWKKISLVVFFPRSDESKKAVRLAFYMNILRST